MVSPFSTVLQSPSYDGSGGTGEQIPLPTVNAAHQGASLAEVISLFGDKDAGDEPFNIAIELGKLKEIVQLQGFISARQVDSAALESTRQGSETYKSALALRDALRRTRLDWPQETASGTWGSTGLPDEQQDDDTDRADNKVRLVYDRHEANNDGDQGLFMLYGAVGTFQVQLQAPVHRDLIPFNVTFVATEAAQLPASGISGLEVIEDFESYSGGDRLVDVGYTLTGTSDDSDLTVDAGSDIEQTNTCLARPTGSSGGAFVRAHSTGRPNVDKGDTFASVHKHKAGSAITGMMFGVSDAQHYIALYCGYLESTLTRVTLASQSGSSGSFTEHILDENLGKSYTTDAMDFEVDWALDDTVTVNVYEMNSSTLARGSLLYSNSASVSRNASNTGMGWVAQHSSGDEAWFDYYRKNV